MLSFLQSLLPYLPKFWHGFVQTLHLTVWSSLFGFLSAIPLVVGLLYGNAVLKNTCRTFITIIRGTPMLVQLFFIYYGLPQLGIRPTPMQAALIGFVVNSAAYQAEYLKGGFLAISSEQMEAACAIGLNTRQAVGSIIFPQALRFAIPALSNEVVYLIQYTSVAYYINVDELFAQSQFYATDTYRFLEIMLLLGAVYLLLIFLVTRLTDWLERRLYIPGFDTKHLQ